MEGKDPRRRKTPKQSIPCSALNCNRRKYAGSHFVMHTFPSNPVRCREWVVRSGNPKLLAKPISLVSNRAYLCQYHFTSDQYISLEKRRLISKALPSIFPATDITQHSITTPTMTSSSTSISIVMSNAGSTSAEPLPSTSTQPQILSTISCQSLATPLPPSPVSCENPIQEIEIQVQPGPSTSNSTFNPSLPGTSSASTSISPCNTSDKGETRCVMHGKAADTSALKEIGHRKTDLSPCKYETYQTKYEDVPLAAGSISSPSISSASPPSRYDETSTPPPGNEDYVFQGDEDTFHVKQEPSELDINETSTPPPGNEDYVFQEDEDTCHVKQEPPELDISESFTPPLDDDQHEPQRNRNPYHLIQELPELYLSITLPYLEKELLYLKMESIYDEMLVDMVSKYPILFNRSMKEFRDVQKKDRIWSEIGQVLQCTGSECSARWMTLRERFVRESKVKKTSLPSGSGAMFRKQWPLLESMMWLQPYIRTRKTFGNFRNEERSTSFDSTTHPSPSYPSIPNDTPYFPSPTPSTSSGIPSPRPSTSPITCSATPDPDQFHLLKRKRGSDLEGALVSSLTKFGSFLEGRKSSSEDDEDDLFCKSLVLSLKRLNGKEKNEAKRKLLEVMIDFEK